MFAQQQADRTKKKPRFTPEQMMEMQTNRIVKALALDDATTAKFTPVYTQYLKDLRECRAEAWKQMKQDKAEAGKQPGAKKEMLTDAEVEQRIKDRFAHSRKMLDLQEKYYTEFRKVLSPKQIEKSIRWRRSTMVTECGKICVLIAKTENHFHNRRTDDLNGRCR